MKNTNNLPPRQGGKLNAENARGGSYARIKRAKSEAGLHVFSDWGIGNYLTLRGEWLA